jgi:NAD(P) transhydrogenase subunit alpha
MMRRSLSLVLVSALAMLAMAGSVFAQEAAAAEHGHDFVAQFSIFVLAVFVGYYVVWSVTPALHTPLMSVTNAISSVIVVGALLAVAVESGDADASSGHWLAKMLGLAALVMASVNIFGGFLVTQRMLGMYQKKQK